MPKPKNIKVHAQQAKMMKSAGFLLIWKKEGIAYWQRGHITIGCTINKPMTVEKLVDRCIQQTIYWTKQKSEIIFREFETKNIKTK